MDRKKLEQVLTIVGDMHDALAFKNAGDGRAKMRIAAGLVRELLAEAADQPANPAQVTDAMVEAAARKIGEVFYGDEGELNDLTASQWITLRSAAQLSLTAAIGAGGQAVVVKPLEWKPVHGASGVWWKADNPLGGLPYEAIDEADKTRHQAAFERRILSALSQPHPDDERVVEALRSLLTLTKFELADNVNRQPWARAVEKAETALSAKEGRKNG